jgi:hypothetical protein
MLADLTSVEIQASVMYIDPKGQIFGYPAMRIRDLLRNLSSVGMWTVDNLKERLQTPKAEAERLLKELHRLGYVELESSHPGTEFWKNTLRGSALGLASSARPLKRTTAIRVVKEFLGRVRRVNADPYYLFPVTKVVVFGSYLSDNERINDVDMGIYLRPKESDTDKHMALCRRRSMLAAQQGRTFNTFVDELTWAQQEVLKFLKFRSRAISLHYRDAILDKVETKTLFEED